MSSELLQVMTLGSSLLVFLVIFLVLLFLLHLLLLDFFDLLLLEMDELSDLLQNVASLSLSKALSTILLVRVASRAKCARMSPLFIV